MRLTLIILLLLSVANQVFGQKKFPYTKVSGYVQLWARHTMLNPGTVVNEEVSSSISDVTLRRYRVKAAYYFAPNKSIRMVVGNNNQNLMDGSPISLQLLDFYYQQEASSWLTFGIGKVAVAGPLRYSAPPSSSNLSVDIPLHQIPTLNKWDQKARKLTAYGLISLNNTRALLSISRPIVSSGLSTTTTGDFRASGLSPVYGAYIQHYLKGKEAFRSPYAKATYLGKKELFVIGMGVQYSPQAILGVENNQDFASLGADVFLEEQIGHGKSITGYFSYQRNVMGDDYLRQVGANNPAKKGTEDALNFSKPGNAVPLIGNGSYLHTQLGLLTDVKWIDAKIQYYAEMKTGQFTKYDLQTRIWGGGLNILLNGHKSKFTLGVENRPFYLMDGEVDLLQAERKSTYVLQYQVKI